MNYILNGAQIENMATQLNKANRTAIRQCECEKIAADNKRLREELEDAINLCADSRIVDIPGLGPYHRVDVSEATIDEWRKALEGKS